MADYRFTLRFLFGLMAFVAVALALFRYVSHITFVATFSLTVAALAFSLIAVAVTRGGSRAFAIGFAIAGGIHLLLAFSVGMPPGFNFLLLTRYLLDQLAPLMLAGPLPQNPDQRSLVDELVNFTPNSPPAKYIQFLITGQSLFTLILATAGGAFGVFLHNRSNRNDERQLS